ncbi:ABC transporter permease subunit [Devosia sp. FKR38]|uniref:ABC transporter permease n=1 Tax=Devosia sp. FKR38 TaxID=2562312 RepID=UPI0010C0EB79|nr:ABC transporter permease subunit [Devosia sp. FKR38]
MSDTLSTAPASAPLVKWRPTGLLFIAAPILLIAVFLFYPALRSIWGTIYVRQPDGSYAFSIASYLYFFSDSYSLTNLGRTFWTTIVTMVLLIAINLPIAIYLRFKGGRLAVFIQVLALFPMFVPGIVIVYALIRYLGPNGLLQTLLEVVGIGGFQSPYLTPWGPVIGMVWDAMPFTLLVLTAGMSGIATSAIEAAQDVGAGRLRILFSIILPQIKNSLLVVTSLNFLGLFGQAFMPFMLGPTSPEMMGPFMLRTFSTVRDPLQAATQATIVFALCSVAGLAYVRSIAKRRAAELVK